METLVDTIGMILAFAGIIFIIGSILGLLGFGAYMAITIIVTGWEMAGTFIAWIFG